MGNVLMTYGESVIATREWFAENARQCIEEAKSGITRVNDLDSYIAWREEAARASLAGEGDHSFAFQQRRHFIQTGECVPFFAPVQS
jgi:hypothetical protein